MGLQTVLGVAKRGFFIPHRYAEAVEPPRIYPALLPLFRAAHPAFEALLRDMAEHAATLGAMAGPPPEPRLDQTWFPSLDMAAAYALVQRHRPKRLLEIGSGHSTRLFLRAGRDADCGLTITAIDPDPRADLKALEGAAFTLIRAPLQQVPEARLADLLESLGPGDMLSLDGSHILMPGSDVDLLLTSLLPRIGPGVLVHIHDVFLPFGYPAAWDWRGYNEQSAVAALLLGGWDILWSSAYALSAEARAAALPAPPDMPMPEDAKPASIWLRRR